jgi:hypothetical protein
MDYIIKVAAVLSALGVIFAVGKKAISAINSVVTDIKDLKAHSNENYMSLLRLTIMSSEMPIGERIVAGHKYLEAGGNGEVRRFLESEFNITETVDEAEHYKK